MPYLEYMGIAFGYPTWQPMNMDAALGNNILETIFNDNKHHLIFFIHGRNDTTIPTRITFSKITGIGAGTNATLNLPFNDEVQNTGAGVSRVFNPPMLFKGYSVAITFVACVANDVLRGNLYEAREE